jgi:hypothetical protein
MILRKLDNEIRRFSSDAREHIKVIDGFENCIMEWVLFVKDRDNFITSRICNTHRNYITSIHAIASAIPAWTNAFVKEDNPVGTVADHNSVLMEKTNSLIKTVIDINKDTRGRINSFIEDIPKFIENINIELVLINNRINELESFKIVVLQEYKKIKCLSISNLRSLTDGSE